jgi:hypothetical protein
LLQAVLGFAQSLLEGFELLCLCSDGLLPGGDGLVVIESGVRWNTLLVDVLVETIKVSIELEEVIQFAHEVLCEGAVASSGCGGYASAGGSIRLRTVVWLPTLLPFILRVLHCSGSDKDERRLVQRQAVQIGAWSGALYGGAGQDGCEGDEFMR